MKYSIPYGHNLLELKLNDTVSVECITNRLHNYQPAYGEAELVARAMQSPVGSLPLNELAARKKNAVIIISDHTRPVPSRLILPPMLAALRKGSPDIKITLLVATGCHRLTTPEELQSKLGEEIFHDEKIVVHDCDRSPLINLGKLPSGAELIVNSLICETDLLIAEGFIEPHFFAGFSGGRKSILPGVCSRKTVLGNHCASFIADPSAFTGILEGNPIHRDMVAAAKMAGLKYIVNTVLDADKKVIAAFAGDPFKAHEKGCAFLKEQCSVTPEHKSDIVITSNGGAPLDQNVYQAVKGITAAEQAVLPGGVIIMCAECADGIGGDSFYKALKECSSPAALMDEILRVPMDETIPDQWQYQILVRILMNHKVIFVTHPELETVIREMKMDYASTPEEALKKAFSFKGENASVTVIPDGVSVIVENIN